jgi:hypothetical protein
VEKDMLRTTILTALLLLGALVLAGGSASAQEAGRASKSELSRTEYFLGMFEKKVARMRGQPFRLGYEENEALKRIKALKEKYPDDPNVEAFFQRARAALIASKGEGTQVTPDMLAYRENEKKLVALFAAEAEKRWQAFREKALGTEGAIEKAFPAPGPRDADAGEMMGRYVLIEGFEYPRNQFYDMGREFVHVGSGTSGYYYVDIGNRSWLAAYEAVKRYRRLVNANVPENGPWTIVGKITGIELLIPQAGEEKVGAAHWGWSVVPEAIYVPGLTFAEVRPESELGGVFAGEGRMEEIKGPLYTVKSIPEDVTPERLIEIFAIAIKEKNYELFLDCIDPKRKATPTALSRIRYHWDLHQGRFAELYCHVTIVEDRTNVIVLKGYDESSDTEGFFLTEEEKSKIRERSEPLVEEATVWTKAWTERGAQHGSEKPHYLRRYEKKRWYIDSYESPY